MIAASILFIPPGPQLKPACLPCSCSSCSSFLSRSRTVRGKEGVRGRLSEQSGLGWAIVQYVRFSVD